MHILEIPSFFPPYGGLFCLDQAKALKTLGHEVRILSNVQLGATIGLRDYVVRPYLRFEHVMDGITVCQSYQRGLPRMVHHNVNRWVNIVCSMFDDYAKKYGKPDVLHAHCAKWAGYAAMLISRKYGMPYVITEHLPLMLLEEEFGKAPSAAWQIGLLREAYEQAAIVLPVSAELPADTACYYGTNYKWQYLSNTIDTDFFHYQARTASEGRPFRFCCLADYNFRKGYDVLFAAFRQLHALRPDTELHIAGQGTDSSACRSVLSDGIVPHGLLRRDAVRELLYQSDALVLASRSEVQPLVLLEAMSTGIPVVATACIPQCLRIEGGCSIVPVGDADALARAMQQLMEKPAADGKHLSEQVYAMASPQVVGKRLEAIFSEVLASH